MAVGSSPRVRGKLSDAIPGASGKRIIPARAGQTGWTRPSAPPRPDHPRACGANVADLVELVCEPGSSPRVRGKLVPNLRFGGDDRIIPARAGQTMSCLISLTSASDHPRACGANMGMTQKLKDKYGSSPRVRGKRALLRLPIATVRIIPARAGQTALETQIQALETDHPRACGANAMLKNGAYTGNGSSPRVRGKHLAGDYRVRRHRIIPARAGQTKDADKAASDSSDHPRACGANSTTSRRSWSASGSSPRVRGKLRVDEEHYR